jgi:hypothetical protein
MKRDGWTYGVAFVLLAVGAGSAQNKAAPPTWDPSASEYPHQSAAPQTDPSVPESEPAPALWNGYEVHGSAEFGGRGVSSSGDLGLYSTYVNLGSGPRLLDQSIEMHSVNHNGFLFDDLSMSSFGYGGDPNDVTRLSLDKGRWYDFSGIFRRDQNYWDYNLLANPLNPSTSTPALAINDSPHLLNLSRKMTDLDLKLLPQSKIRFDLGYSHYSNGGTSFTTDHQGTEAELFQPTRDLTDTYHFGISWLPIARTRLSYSQYFTHVKSDTADVLDSFPNALSNGTPANLGISFDTKNGLPCAAPITASGAANPTCNLYTGYSNFAPYRTNIPTEQLSFQSNYFKRLELTGLASYTGARSDVPFSEESFAGVISRTHGVSTTTTSTGHTQNITTSADLGASYDISDKLRINDSFRWYDFRLPGAATLVSSALFSPSGIVPPNPFSATACPPPYTGPGCPQHSASSGADLSTDVTANYEAQNQKANTFEVEYEFSPKVGANLGYRFERRDIALNGTDTILSTFDPTLATRGGCTTLTNGICQTTAFSTGLQTVEINDHGALFGIWLRPMRGLRINSDIEIDSADNVFTNIMPRHFQWYRVKGNYTPRGWLNFSGGANIRESRDLSSNLGNLQHNRSYSVGAVITRSARWSFDFNYNYDDLLTNINICFVETPTPAFANTSGALCGAAYLSALSFYHDISNFGSANLMFKPVRRVTLTLGYTLTSTSGSSLLLNPLASLGPVAYNYHLPTAALAYDITQHVTFKTGWNYYDYDEKSVPVLVAPRNFRANIFATSLRFSM